MVTMVGYVFFGQFSGHFNGNRGRLCLLAVGFLEYAMVLTVDFVCCQSIFWVFLKKKKVLLFLFIAITYDQQATKQLTNQIN